MELETELATYAKEKERLISQGHAGRFVLIHRDSVDSVWDTQRDAIQAGYMRIGLPPFLVREIKATPHKPAPMPIILLAQPADATMHEPN